MIARSQILVWVHTWWGRENVHLPYADSLAASDVGPFSVMRQPKGEHRVDFYLRTLRKICANPANRYMLRIEDDAKVSPFIMHNTLRWDVLEKPKFAVGFLSTCPRVLSHCGISTAGANTLKFTKHGCHFGGAWIASCSAIKTHLPRIEAIMWAFEKLGGFGPTTSVSDAFVDAGLGTYIHMPALAMVDVSVPSHRFGDVRKRYGEQPFDPEFVR